MPTDRLSPRRRARAIAPGAIAAALVLTATGCGSPGTPSSQAAAAGASPTHRPMAESARFGPDCGMIPATGMGSFHGMAMDPDHRCLA